MKVTHKYYRDLGKASQYRKCDGVRCNFAENVVYHWRKVTCKACLKKRGVK